MQRVLEDLALNLPFCLVCSHSGLLLRQVGGDCEPRGMVLNYLLAGW